MLGSKPEKQLTEKEKALKKVEAWKTINSTLVKTQNNYFQMLKAKLVEKEAEHAELKAKLESGNGTADDNATFLYLTGYVQCLKDITKGKQV